MPQTEGDAMTEAVQPTTYIPAAPPANAAEAVTRLDALKADSAWANGVLAGNGPHVAEFKSLTGIIAGGDNVDRAMAGVREDGIFQSSEHAQMIAATNMFREIGISDAVIRQALTDYEVTAQEYAMVEKWKADRMGDSEWVKKYLAGERQQTRDMMLADIVLSSSIKKDSAAA
jgi:hypothetical protein